MFRIIAAAALAAFVIYDVTAAPGLVAMADANAPQRSLKGDRLPIGSIGPDCSTTAWPHYDSTCVRNRTQLSDQPRKVRTVSIERPLAARAELADFCDCHR